LFFQDPVSRLVVVNCNPAVTFSPLEEPLDNSPLRRPLPELVQRTWEDFDLGDLGEGDVLVIDDLQRVNERVREIVTAATHHLALGHCFLVTHSVLGSKQYELLNLVHRIALFCSSTSVANLAGYVLSTRILDPDLKSRLREALGAAQRSREVLVLELSALPESVQPYHVACSHLLSLANPDRGFAVVYPHPSRIEMYEDDAGDLGEVELRRPAEVGRSLPGEFVAGSFLLLRPDQVDELKKKKKKKKKKVEAGSDSASNDEPAGKCMDVEESTWNATVIGMEKDVENFLPSKQWRVCKSLLYEILHNSKICLLKGGRRIGLRDRPEVGSSVIDYLTAATRRAAPTERRAKNQTDEYKNFRQITAVLLAEYAPRTLFKNRMVLPGPAESRRKTPPSVPKRRRRGKKRKGRKRDSPASASPRSEGVEFGDLDFSALN
jgi:hypothetical protein